MNRNITVSTYENNTLLFKENTTCILDDEYLIYSTDTDRIRINTANFSFTKENNETIFKINKEKCSLFVKELKQALEIPIDYINYTYEDDIITIEYKLISQENALKIKIVIGEINNEI